MSLPGALRRLRPKIFAGLQIFMLLLLTLGQMGSDLQVNMTSWRYLNGATGQTAWFSLPDVHPRSRYWISLDAARAGDSATVLRILDASAELIHDHFLLSMLALAYDKSNNGQAAIATWKQLHNTYALGEYAGRMVQQENFDDAIAAYYALWELDSGDVRVISLASLLRKRSDLEMAEYVLKRSLNDHPTSPYRIRWLRSLALTLEAQGHWDEAAQVYQGILSEDPRDVDTYIALGKLYYDMGQGLDQAIAELYKAAAIAPADSRPYTEMGRLYLEEHCYQEAVSALEQAGRFAPENDAIYYLLAWAYRMNEQADLAVQAIEYAIRLRPEAVSYLRRAGQIYEYAGDNAAAVEAYRAVLRFRPDDQPAQKAIIRLANQ